MFQKICIFLLLSFLINSSLYAAKEDEQSRSLLNDIDAILSSPEIRNSSIGIAVKSLKNNEIIYKRNESINFVPASVQKIFTSAAALELLGASYQFETGFYLDGTINSNGEFIGNIVIRAYGDPTQSDYYYEKPSLIFDNWINQLDSLGITSIKGTIIGDDSYFDNKSYPEGWAWDDLVYPYSAPVNALTFYDNHIDIALEAGKFIDEPAYYRILPNNSYIKIINNVKTSKLDESPNVITIRDGINNNVEILGTIPIDSIKQNPYFHSVSILNPTYFYLHNFMDRLVSKNIKFRGALIDIDDWNEKISYYKLKPLNSILSPNLERIVKVVNTSSHNLASEMLLKTIGKETNGYGTFEDGIESMKAFLIKAGINTENIVIKDGSGLSRQNLVSPYETIALLKYMYNSQNKTVFLNSLASPGEEGTLKRRLKNSLAQKKVLAKTGTMNNISTLAGYVKSKDDEDLAFAIFFNNFTCPLSSVQNIQDLIVMRLASFSRKKS